MALKWVVPSESSVLRLNQSAKNCFTRKKLIQIKKSNGQSRKSLYKFIVKLQ